MLQVLQQLGSFRLYMRKRITYSLAITVQVHITFSQFSIFFTNKEHRKEVAPQLKYIVP